MDPDCKDGEILHLATIEINSDLFRFPFTNKIRTVMIGDKMNCSMSSAKYKGASSLIV
jgi:hypothetical protein